MKCQPEIRTINRRKLLERVRRSARYRARRAYLISGKTCSICGTDEKLTIHHTSGEDYKDPETYYQTLDKGDVMCFDHHKNYHKGMTKICPVCHKELIFPQYDCCWGCLPEEVKSRIKEGSKNKKWNKIRNEINQKRYREFIERKRREGKG